MPTQTESNSTYLTKDGERERLDKQFWYYRNHHGYGSIYDLNASIPADGAILDSGTGSGVWLLTLAKELPCTVSLYGIDLSPTHFRFESAPDNVNFSLTSVTALPTEWSSKFNLVSQSLLLASLSASQTWPLAIKELYHVIKPGGHIQLLEPTSLYSYRNLLRYNLAPESAAKQMCDLMHAIQMKYDYLQDVPNQITEMLADAGFRNICCDVKEPPRLGAWHGGGYGFRGLEIFIDLLKVAKDAVLMNDGFGIIRDAAEFDDLVARYREECEEKGYPAVEVCLVYAQK